MLLFALAFTLRGQRQNRWKCFIKKIIWHEMEWYKKPSSLMMLKLLLDLDFDLLFVIFQGSNSKCSWFIKLVQTWTFFFFTQLRRVCTTTTCHPSIFCSWFVALSLASLCSRTTWNTARWPLREFSPTTWNWNNYRTA